MGSRNLDFKKVRAGSWALVHDLFCITHCRGSPCFWSQVLCYGKIKWSYHLPTDLSAGSGARPKFLFVKLFRSWPQVDLLAFAFSWDIVDWIKWSTQFCLCWWQCLLSCSSCWRQPSVDFSMSLWMLFENLLCPHRLSTSEVLVLFWGRVWDAI